MDFKEILPFLIVVAISIIGSLTKKKTRKGGQSQKKSVFDTFLDELNGRNSVEVKEEHQPQPIFEVDEMEPEDVFEEPAQVVIPVHKNNPEPISVREKEPISLVDHYNQRQKRNHETERSRMEVVHIDSDDTVHTYSLNNIEEARKAIVYTEIIKPRYF